KLLLAATDDYPKDVAPWLLLADLNAAGGQPETALGVLDDAAKKLGDRIELRLARIAYWSRRGGDEGRRALEQLGQWAESLNGDDRTRADRALANGFAGLGDNPRAVRFLTDGADQAPDDPEPAFRLFELALLDDNVPAMDGAIA